MDSVVLTTVGLDIGSATTHLMISRVHLRKQAHDYSPRFVVVARETLFRSPIHLTPYRAEGAIDAAALEIIVDDSYRASGYARADIDAGAVILTGLALQRANARAIAELFAYEGGKFVCATAGHRFEALLSAHGSGAVRRSAQQGEAVLNVDIGGGTTKLALAVAGDVVATMAIVGGSRLLEFDDEGAVSRVDPAGAALAGRMNVPLSLGRVLAETDRARLADGLAERIVAAAWGRVDPGDLLAGGLPADVRPAAIFFSGGVAELLFDPSGSFRDLGPELAAALRARVADLPAPLEASTERIRATVIGASQFSVQVSGNTVYVSDPDLLPLRNLPVIPVSIPEQEPDHDTVRGRIEREIARLDLDRGDGVVAVALRWSGPPEHRSLFTIARAIAGTHLASPRRRSPVVVVLQGDFGRSLGHVLVEELAIRTGVVAVDGLELLELDYIDIGRAIMPSGVLPVVVKSLLFAGGAPLVHADLRAAPAAPRVD